MIFCNNLICKSCFEVVPNGVGIKLSRVQGTDLSYGEGAKNTSCSASLQEPFLSR